MRYFLIICWLLMVEGSVNTQKPQEVKNRVQDLEPLEIRGFTIPNGMVDFSEGVREVEIGRGKRFRGLIRGYSLGQRKSGDSLLGKKEESIPCDKNVCRVVVAYSLSEKGGVITSMTCIVDLMASKYDDSLSIRPYVQSGGIGQHSIALAIELYKTVDRYISIIISCRVYGY